MRVHVHVYILVEVDVDVRDLSMFMFVRLLTFHVTFLFMFIVRACVTHECVYVFMVFVLLTSVGVSVYSNG